MRYSTLTAIVSFSIAFSMPAVAGPNWDVIHRAEANKAHRAEANKAAHKHENALVLPLDYGPRAITTPWVNREQLSEQVSKLDTQQQVAHSHDKKKSPVVATHTHHHLSSHS